GSRNILPKASRIGNGYVFEAGTQTHCWAVERGDCWDSSPDFVGIRNDNRFSYFYADAESILATAIGRDERTPHNVFASPPSTSPLLCAEGASASPKGSFGLVDIPPFLHYSITPR